MKLIIAGSRTINSVDLVSAAVYDSGWIAEIREIICGKARGADTAGETFAKSRGIRVSYFPADWKTYRKAAGPLRNKEMGLYADRAIILWDGSSTGSRHMASVMYELRKPFILHQILVREYENRWEYTCPLGHYVSNK